MTVAAAIVAPSATGQASVAQIRTNTSTRMGISTNFAAGKCTFLGERSTNIAAPSQRHPAISAGAMAVLPQAMVVYWSAASPVPQAFQRPRRAPVLMICSNSLEIREKSTAMVQRAAKDGCCVIQNQSVAANKPG